MFLVLLLVMFTSIGKNEADVLRVDKDVDIKFLLLTSCSFVNQDQLIIPR